MNCKYYTKSPKKKKPLDLNCCDKSTFMVNAVDNNQVAEKNKNAKTKSKTEEDKVSNISKTKVSDVAEVVVNDRKKKVHVKKDDKTFSTLQAVEEVVRKHILVNLDVNDCETSSVLLGRPKAQLEALASSLLQEEMEKGLQEQNAQFGPNKFEYEEGDSYDWHLALGCLNCGAPYDLNDRLYDLNNKKNQLDLKNQESNISSAPFCLFCSYCGQRACAKHYNYESEGLQDRLESKENCDGSIYLYGCRRQYNFGPHNKRWWQEKLCPPEHQSSNLASLLFGESAEVPENKGATCHEECKMCGHNVAYYKCYQARSADEGMTIMYECCACGNRTISR